MRKSFSNIAGNSAGPLPSTSPLPKSPGGQRKVDGIDPTAPPPDARLKGLVDSHRRKLQGNLRSMVSCEDQDLLGYRGLGDGGGDRILSVPDPVQVAARWGGEARRCAAVAARRLQAEGARSLHDAC